VENFGRLYGSNQPISAHFTAFNSSDQLQRKRSSIFQEALLSYSLKRQQCTASRALIEPALKSNFLRQSLWKKSLPKQQALSTYLMIYGLIYLVLVAELTILAERSVAACK